MSRFGQLRQRLRQAYAKGRESVRTARERESARRAEEAAERDRPILEPVSPTGEPAVSTTSRDDADVPRGLRIAAAWSWRIIVIGLLGWALLRVFGAVRVVIVPLLLALLLAAL